MEGNNPVRLQVFLARGGIASRRRCETFIADGRVKVNGRVVREPGTKVSDEDKVLFDEKPVRAEKRRVYVALNKPSGFLCSDDDPDGRPLAKSLIAPAVKERVFHVGRLDYMSTGLIFFTNDGDFARAITHPGSQIEKEYVITTRDEIPRGLIDDFLAGMTVDGVAYRAIKAVLVGPRTARVVLVEGKNREIRRVFLSRSIKVKKVHRVRIGGVGLGGLTMGRFRNLKSEEVERLLKNSQKGGNRRGRGHRRTGGGR